MTFHSQVLTTPLAISETRPDRTADGFHYSHRQPKAGAWVACPTEPEANSLSDCVRNATDWPPVVSSTIAGMVASLLCASEL